MEDRYLKRPIEEIAFAVPKMAFVSGARQAGKTTLARLLLAERSAGRYANWDDVTTRRAWVKDPATLAPIPSEGRPLLVLDEIHKARGWKRTVKGLWDQRGPELDVLVTGSARLNVYRKGSDSLLGRYFHFRLHPFSLAELTGARAHGPDEAMETIQTSRLVPDGGGEALQSLLRFGGFPEPLLGQNDRRARLWRRSRVEQVIREDLRDLSRLPELSRIEMLAALLPERVGSPLSVASLARDLEGAHDTVRRWLEWLRELYYVFEIKPFSHRITRSLRKEGKVYLVDWGEIDEPGARFENLVACHLLKAVDYWTDTGEGRFDLHYVRDKEKRELDFLVTRDKRPWLAVEAKLSDTQPSKAWATFLPQLGCKLGIQVVATPGHHAWHTIGNARLLVASAEHVLAALV